ncbi:GAF domain-containing protein [Polaromonas sp.]|uniref:GAF domain-containing protein n=1 Tax=Polaromonas sp. TaxID=1869339 RepID=UPI00286B25BA|nr:GAF domain-containing protein [Polaromonas sp.]
MRNDPARLAELRKHLILDSSSERAYDDITRLLASSLEVPIAIVNLLDEKRDWFKSCVGLPNQESPAETSFCEAFFNSSDDVIVAEDTASDPRFASHPFVVGEPFIRFYAAARLAIDGHTVGTLCAYDVQPRKVSAAQIAQMQTLAAAVIELIGQRPDPA